MVDVIRYLQSIQDNLIGIVLPVLITAFVSLVTIFVNMFMQILTENNKINSEQYKLMQEFYPHMKISLLELKLNMQEVENNPIFSDWQTAINKYTNYKKNEKQYRKENENEVQNIDEFIESMDDFSKKVININDFLRKGIVPRTPVMRLLLKRKISKMLTILYYYSLLWNQYQAKNISAIIFRQEINDFKKNWKVEFDRNKIVEYLSLLDKWLLKY